MSHKKSPGLWIETGVDEKISVVMVDGFGQEQRLPPVTPAEDLIHAAEIDYSAYRREIRNLWEKHPLFKKRLHIPVSDLEDLTEEAVTLPSMLQETDPLSFLALGSILDRALRIEDDGSALFLLYAGERLLRALEIPFRTQIRLRNIMEITFDGTERNTQQERFQKLRGAYPKIAQFCDPANPDFDPELKYPSSMMILDLRTDTDTPQWQYLSREELIRKDQEGHQSLRDQYGGGTAASSSKQEDGNSEDS